MWARFPGLSEKAYRITDITNGEPGVSVVFKAMLLEIKLFGRSVWIPLLTQPDTNHRTEVEHEVRLDSWITD